MNKTNKHYKTYRLLAMLFVVILSLGLTVTAMAFTWAEPPDATPGAEVILRGDNSDGKGYLEFEPIQIDILNIDTLWSTTCDTSVSAVETNGYLHWECSIFLSTNPAEAVGNYEYTATGGWSGVTDFGTFTDGPLLTTSPLEVVLTYDATQQFSATSGTSPYTYEVFRNETGGTITSTGLYTAGSTDGTDVIRIVDSKGVFGYSYAYVGSLGNGETINNSCILDIYRVWGQGNDLQCTANDVQLARVVSWEIENGDGCDRPGDTVTFTAVYEVELTAQARHDVGIYFATDGDPNSNGAYTGNCSVSSLPYSPEPDFLDLDGIGDDVFGTNDPSIVQDVCGDIDDKHNPIFYSITQTAVCLDEDHNGFLDLPYCTSWREPGPNNVCTSPSDAFPGAPSKCWCEPGFDIPVPVPGAIIVDKVTDPTADPTSFEFTVNGAATGQDPITPIVFYLTDAADPWESSILYAGSYNVVETEDARYSTTSICISDIGDPETAESIELDPGETVTCTFTNTLNAYDLTVTKTATPSYTRTYSWDIYKNVDKTTANIPDGGSATFNYTVGVTHNSGTDSAWQIAGSITVDNPNSFDVTGVDITDATPGGTCTVDDGTDLTIAAGGDATVSSTCTFASNPESGTNTTTATWADFGTGNTSASGTANYDFTSVTPAIVNGSVNVTDTLGGSFGPVYYIDPSPKEFTYSHTFYGVGGTCTKYDNTATITENGDFAKQTVEVCIGLDLTVEKTAAGTYDRTYHWLIDKDVDDTLIEIAAGGTATFNYDVTVTPNGFTDSGWTLGGTITVANPNDWQTITADVTDLANIGGGVVCTVVGGTGVVVPMATVAGPGEVTLNYSCTFTGEPAYTGLNTATADWSGDLDAVSPTTSDSGTAAIGLTLDQETYKVITVVDDKTDPLNPVTLGTWDWADGAHTFEYALDKDGVDGTCTDYTNTAVIDETDQDDSQTVTVCVGIDLTVAKTGAGTFDREYFWEIFKDVDKNYVTAFSTNVTFNYTVIVNQTGFEDSGWEVHGTITIANPNDWEAITLTSLADMVDNGGTCTVAAGPYVIPANGSLDVNYSCSYAADPSSYSGLNTATATWDAATFYTPGGTAEGTKAFTLNKDGETHKTVEVEDTFAGALGTVTATDIEPWALEKFYYSRTVPAPASACETYDNTASIVDPPLSASQTVQVCMPSLLTDTEHCTLIDDQFRILFTPDLGHGLKLNATNPGQFYYNFFYSGPGDEMITLILPYPWVTQGNVPIHAYSDLEVYTNSKGQTCLIPGTPLPNPPQDHVYMSDYDQPYPPPSYDFEKTHTVEIWVPSTGTAGFAYLDIHLDYGLKGTTNYAKGGPSGNDAIDMTTFALRIKDLQQYTFSDSYLDGYDGEGGSGEKTIRSVNVFKKNPGVGGKTDNYSVPVKNAKVQIWINGKLYGQATTDEDGWYMWQYKWVGKRVTVNVDLFLDGIIDGTPDARQIVVLKANGFIQVDFDLNPLPYE